MKKYYIENVRLPGRTLRYRLILIVERWGRNMMPSRRGTRTKRWDWKGAGVMGSEDSDQRGPVTGRRR